MSDYLKDLYIPFHTIGSKEIEEIDRELKSIITEAKSIPGEEKPLFVVYTLRYDGMGIIRRDFEEIKDCFNRARKVDRLVFNVTGTENLSHNVGKGIQIWLELLDPGRCQLIITDDDEKWVDNIFKRLSTRFSQYKNHNGILRLSLAELLIQLFGVTAGFSACLISASLLSPHVEIQHAFFVLFIGLLLIFSNLWTFILELIGKVRNKYWPAISFKRKPLGIIGQSIMGLVITGLLTSLVSWAVHILERASSLVIK